MLKSPSALWLQDRDAANYCDKKARGRVLLKAGHLKQYFLIVRYGKKPCNVIAFRRSRGFSILDPHKQHNRADSKRENPFKRNFFMFLLFHSDHQENSFIRFELNSVTTCEKPTTCLRV